MLDYISVNIAHFQTKRRFFVLAIFDHVSVILIYVAFRLLTALGPPFLSPKDRPKLKLRQGQAKKQQAQYLSIFMSTIKCGSSRSIDTSFAFKRWSSNIHAVPQVLQATFSFSLKCLFFALLQIIYANFMQILLFECAKHSLFLFSTSGRKKP